MSLRKVEIYIDFAFFEKVLDALATLDVLNDDFDVYKSFYKFIQEPHVRLIFLDSGVEVKATDLIRVFQSRLTRGTGENAEEIAGIESETFKYTKHYGFRDLRNPQSIFLGEVFADVHNELSKRQGFVFSDFRHFKSIWRRLLLLGVGKTIHIKKLDEEIKSFWNEFLSEYQLPCNALVLVDRYLSTWFKTKTTEGREESNITTNLLPILDNMLQENSPSCYLITCDSEFDDFHNLSTLQDRLNDRSLSYKLFLFFENKMQGNLKSKEGGIEKRENLLKKLHNSRQEERQRLLQELSKLRRDKTELKKEYNKLRSMVHDRYIITNYYIFIFTHSIDVVNYYDGRIQKDTQIIIEPLLSIDFFRFYTSKIESYRTITNWETNPALGSDFCFVLSKEDRQNMHFN